MDKNLKHHFIIVIVINLAFVVHMIRYTGSNEPDQAMTMITVFYPALIIVNFLVWMIMKVRKDRRHKVYGITALVLLLFIPVMILLLK